MIYTFFRLRDNKQGFSWTLDLAYNVPYNTIAINSMIAMIRSDSDSTIGINLIYNEMI